MATLPSPRHSSAPSWRIVGTVALLFAAACGPKAEAPKPAATDSVAGVASDTSGMAKMPGMAMTGDPDHDFVRMMGDHHKGLIAMAHEAMEADRGTAESRSDGQKLDAKQDGELEQMVKMLEASWKDPYNPKAMPADLATVDALKQESGQAFASQFYRNVVAHHRRAITMIDEYLPKAVRADVKAMAEKMRRDQLAEIAAFGRKAGTP